MKLLIFGFGNIGRNDDGLGIRFALELEKWVEERGIDFVDFDTNYQLNIEDAENIAGYDIVIFADASTENIDNFIITDIDPQTATTAFSTHSVSPAYVVELSREIHGRVPYNFILHMKGREWKFIEKLSEYGEKVLKNSLEFMKNELEKIDLIEGNSDKKIEKFIEGIKSSLHFKTKIK